ncbi:hypothetical protein FOPE_09163 [Fonsecaea pedrosoi]|nr:hypothetical protein FOPE_09163 [Fonsecaea pedrosoi]
MSFKPISNWSGATSGDDGHLHVFPPKKSHNATPPHSSSNLSTRASAGSEPSPELRAEDSIASVATSQETQENKPRQSELISLLRRRALTPDMGRNFTNSRNPVQRPYEPPNQHDSGKNKQ